MQHRAKLAFQLQTYWAGLAGTLPEREKATYDARSIETSVDGGRPAAEAAKKFLASRGVHIPLDTSENVTTVFLLDIEGTTTPLPFVSQVMFPIILANLHDYVADHYPSDPTVVGAVQQAAIRGGDLRTAFDADLDARHTVREQTELVRHLFVEHLLEQMKNNGKQPYVKTIQGEVWATACERHDITTQVFKDVAAFIKQMGRANQSSTRVAIYSSGSALAQRVIMANTAYGDLTPYIAAFIDPSQVGGKVMPNSYQKIATQLSAQLRDECGRHLQFVFITDSPTEASSADASDAITCSVLCFRPLNAWIPLDVLLALGLPGIASFSQLVDPTAPVDFAGQVDDVRDMKRKYDQIVFQ